MIAGIGKSPSILPFHCQTDERSPHRSNPPDRNASVILPPEILDKILEHICTSREGRRTLIACTLAATWWMRPDQRRLFSSVEIHRGNYVQLVNGVVPSGSKTRLLEHVRSLWHSYGLNYRMRDLAQNSGGYFSVLRNLHHLTFRNIWIEQIDEEDFRACFSAFRETKPSRTSPS